MFQIATPTLEPGEVQEVQDALDERFGVEQGDFSSSSIGPTFGEQIARTALIAIVASLLLISIYISLRFEAKFAVPVLIAVAHDILITAGVYAIFGREVTTSTVAALLTILGYSLYDTIIVFDRIRENVPRMPRATFSQIVNRSMSEVLTRSLVDQPLHAVPGRRADDLRRRDAARLRLRAAGRDRLGRLLVDLHRLAGADALEGARAGLRAPAAHHHGRQRRASARVRNGSARQPRPGGDRGSLGGFSPAACPARGAAPRGGPRPGHPGHGHGTGGSDCARGARSRAPEARRRRRGPAHERDRRRRFHFPRPADVKRVPKSKGRKKHGRRR